MKKWFVISALTLAFSSAKAQNVTNYTFSATTGAYTQITGSPGVTSPNLTSGSLDDGYINSIPIGFTFIYEGTAYTSLSASTNGFVKLGGTFAGNSYNTNNLTNGTPRPALAPLWDDLMMNAGNSISYITTGSYPNRIFTIEWYNVYWSYLAGSPSVSFQIKLYESNRRIEFIYRQEAGTVSSASASIGISGAIAFNYLSLNGTGASPAASSSSETSNLFSRPATGQIYRFDHYPIVPVITSFTPSLGQYGYVVTVNGSGFDAAIASNIVRFGAVKAQVLTATYSSLTVLVPEGVTGCPLSVTTLVSHRTGYSNKLFDVTFPCGGNFSSASYAALTSYSLTSWQYMTRIGDMDGDGKPDLVVAVSTGGLAVIRNTSVTGTINASSFAAPVFFITSGQCGSIDIADLDGDGKLDIIAGDVSLGPDDSVCVFRNTSTVGVINASSFAARVNFPAGNYPEVTAGDIDGDGRPEIITANSTDNVIAVYHNTSVSGTINSASFAPRVTFATGHQESMVRAIDLDGDGKMDIVGSGVIADAIDVFRNTATSGTISAASLAAPLTFVSGNGAYDLTCGDIDGDGKPDVVVGDQSYNGFTVMRNTSTVGTINFAAKVDIPTTDRSLYVDIGDADGDGKPDVVSAPGTAAGTYSTICRNTSTPGTISFSAGYNFNTTISPWCSRLGDMDGDGKPEIVSVDGNGGHFTCRQNVLSYFTSIAPLTVTNATVYCDDGTWKTYSDPANPTQVLFAVKDNGNDLGVITVNEYRDASVMMYNTVHYLQRHFKITPTNQPSTSVQVRLFFTSAELAALQVADPTILSAANLSVTKYDGPTEDNVYFPNDATSLTSYPSVFMINGSMYGGQYLQFTISSFSEFWIHGQSGVLPIHLLNFDATANDDHVDLNWSTASETNNQYFTIEKTQDGTTFETVDVIEGAGNSTTEIDYSTIDPDPYPGTSYYRLKQTDFNGHSTYSELQPVSFDGNSQVFAVYPNPSNGIVHLKCPSIKDAIFTLEVFDLTGKLILSKDGSAADLERESLELPDGVYSLMLIHGDVKYHQKLIVTH